MKTLSSGPSLDFLPCKPRVGLRSRGIFGIAHPGRQDTAPTAGDQRRLGYGFPLAISFPNKNTRAISASVSPAPAPAPAPTNAEGQAIQTNTSEVTNTVPVKFKLHKECAFGQQFMIVGDDPVLGGWDLSGAVPLTWSDGHLWTAEVDLPCDKLIKYKFILKGAHEAITWQPGPDRSLKTWNAEKISVSEDWCNPELQNAVEEELTDLISSNLLTAASDGDQGAAGASSEDGTADGVPIQEQTSENIADLSSNYKAPSPENLTLENNDMAETAGNNLFNSEHETRLVADENIPVLVPGLSPNPQEEIAEPELSQADYSILDKPATTPAPDEVRVLSNHKSKDEQHSTESNETISEEKQQPYAKAQAENTLGTDMEWGKRTLLKFLSSFRFQ